MKTQKTKSAFISALVFIYALSFLPCLKRFLSNCFAAIVSVTFFISFCAIGFFIAKLITSHDYNMLYNVFCYFVFGLGTPALGIYFFGSKIEKLINSL